MAGIGAADASSKIEEAVAVNVFEPGVFSLGYVDGRSVGKAAGNGFGAALGEGLRLRPRNRCAKLDG
jgi:hypothetical protein